MLRIAARTELLARLPPTSGTTCALVPWASKAAFATRTSTNAPSLLHAEMGANASTLWAVTLATVAKALKAATAS